MTRRMATRQVEHERRERWAALVEGLVLGVVLCIGLVGLCILVVALFVALAPSGAALPGLRG